MQTNHPLERKKKPFLWIIPVVAVLLAGAFAFYALYSRRHSPQVSTPVVARGKISPPLPSPSMDSPQGSSVPVDTAFSAEADSPDDASGTRVRNDVESTPTTSSEAGPHENAPEMKSGIAAAPHEDAAAAAKPERADDAEQTGTNRPSDDQAPAPVPGNVLSETAAAGEQQVAVRETPASPPSSEPTATQPSDQPLMNAGPAPATSPADVWERETPYTIQVGAYHSKNNADRQVARMQKKGFEAYIYEKNEKDRRAWYFVRFGRFMSFNAAKQALTALKIQQGIDGAIVRSKSD